MEQEVESGLTGYRHVCSTCLSSDRDVITLNGNTELEQIFRLLMYDYAGEREIPEVEHLVCWECVAHMKKFLRFKRQVQNAQERLWSLDHTYLSRNLSPLEVFIKTGYDKVYFDYSGTEPVWTEQYIVQTSESVKNEQFDVAQVVRENIDLDTIDGNILDVPVLESLDEQTMSQIVVGDSYSILSHDIKAEGLMQPTLAVEISTSSNNKVETVIVQSKPKTANKTDIKCGYITDYMTEEEMLKYRQEEALKVQYASSSYKCELCIAGFYTQSQVEDHFVAAHRPKPGAAACRVCYMYVDEKQLDAHVESHYTRHICKVCGHTEHSVRLAGQHARSHIAPAPQQQGVFRIDPGTEKQQKRKRKTANEVNMEAPKPGDLRKLLSKTTIEGYKCLECDMFFKNTKARKNHVARYHREGLQCDHCKKRFVNRTTLATHLKLHEGPLPRSECPICHKMVRVIQLKYHIRRHQNKTKYECTDCKKEFSHLETYQAHLKYSRAHATEEVFKFPCPMCNKGYPTKEQMQDHFNYQHLGKTTHKCPICDKPIASRVNVEKHMMRVHQAKKEKPRNHVCQECGKAFTDKKALTQHEVIHSGDRPLQCDICHQTFKQKASLYTHRKRVHKVFPNKRVVEFMDTKQTA